MKILVINPGSTTTKIAVFDEEQELFNETIKHSPEDLDKYEKVFQQVDYRKATILDLLAEKGYQLTDFDAVSGRGGMYRPIPGGTYAVNDRVLEDVKNAPYGEHASNIGAYLARLIGDMVGIPSFFVDPPCVDEMTETAHVSGFAQFRRWSQFHALNQKAVARKAAKSMGKAYEDVNLIVCHMGGGISVAAHQHGRCVDINNPKDEGGMSMDRAGGVPANQLITYCFHSGKTESEVRKIFAQKAGVLSYLGTTNFRQICAKVEEGDPEFTKIYNALVYQISKDIGALAVVLKYDVDAIVFTGGLSNSQEFCRAIQSYVGKLTPNFLRFPGEEEMRALAEGALRVLHGEQKALEY